MSGITLTNPVAAMSEKIAQPFDDAASVVRQLSKLYRDANQRLHNNHQTLIVTFEGLGADAFTNMIGKQVKWVDGIVGFLDDQAGFFETCASDVRSAAQGVEDALSPFMDLAQRVVDQLTPDIVVEQGESAVQAVLNDMKAQLKREMHDGGSFLSDIAHGHFGAAADDLVDGAEGLARLGEDAIGLVASLEPYLCQWAADIYQGVNWLLNKLTSWSIDVMDWLFGISDMANDVVVFTDPNATSEEKWLAGIDLGVNLILDIGMLIPGADIFALLGKGGVKLLEKFGLKELEEQIMKRVINAIEKATLKELRERITKKILGAILKKILGNKVLPKIVITDPARKAIYNDLLKKFPDVDPNFLAHLVAANPGVTHLTEEQIENFLKKASTQGDLNNIISLYTLIYRKDLPGVDQLLRDIANGGDGDYKGTLFQMEWLASHMKGVTAIEVKVGSKKGADVVLKNGVYVEIKSRTFGNTTKFLIKPFINDEKKQIDRYIANFKDMKEIQIVLQTGEGGVSSEALEEIKKALEAYGREKGMPVKVIGWPG
jgi:hypothetical protein